MTTSMGSVPPPGPLAYNGAVVVPFIMRTFNPEPTFNTFSVPTIWINTATSNAYILVSKALGVAVWVRIGGQPGEIDTITTPDMVVVVPTAGNINFLNGTGMNITGSGSNITFNVSGAFAAQYTADSGIAVPAANNLNVLGGSTGLTTLGAGSTLSLTGTLNVAHGGTGNTTFTANGVLIGNGTNPVTSTAAGTDGQTLIGNTGSAPTFNAIGTKSGLTAHGVVISQGAGAFTASSAVATNALLMGTTGGDPNWTTSGIPYVAGISFDSGANLLNRYNNITLFTPSIAGSSSPGTATYSSQYGAYSRIGNMVLVQINLEWTGHTGTGDMMVVGFPFIFAAAASFYPMATMVQNIVLPSGALSVVTDGVNATTTAEVACSIDNAPIAQVQMDAAGSVFIMGAYLTDP